MMTSTDLSETDIRKRCEEYFASGYSLKDFCTVEELNEATLQGWLDKFYPEQSDDGFIDANINPDLKDEPKKPASAKKQTSQTLFARVGDIELYHQVSAAYLKSLKG